MSHDPPHHGVADGGWRTPLFGLWLNRPGEAETWNTFRNWYRYWFYIRMYKSYINCNQFTFLMIYIIIINAIRTTIATNILFHRRFSCTIFTETMFIYERTKSKKQRDYFHPCLMVLMVSWISRGHQPGEWRF